ncbi:MAG TPA: hypothetical protein VGQ07_05475 [Nitrospirales bacterium]|jgi:hypothetical protein|nr:hypothetical protein [Nitrospirales bacterium]
MASSDERKHGVLIAYDAMAAPGQTLTLSADLVEEGFITHPPLGGEVLLFQYKGGTLGRTMTGGDGRALLSFVPRATGVEKVTVRVVDSRRVSAAEATATIFVWDRRRPIVIVSLPALATPLRRDFPLPGSSDQLPGPEGGAVQALLSLTRRANLVYVTTRDRLELPEVRQWTAQHRLPAGPIFALKPSPRRLVSELETWRREGWTNIKGGLIGTTEEAKALVEKGLKAVAVPTASSKEKWPEKTVTTTDWKEVAKQLS